MGGFIRYRRPSINNIVSLTRAKKRVNRALCITTIKRSFRALGNMKKRWLRRARYYSKPIKFIRFFEWSSKKVKQNHLGK